MVIAEAGAMSCVTKGIYMEDIWCPGELNRNYDAINTQTGVDLVEQ